MLRFSYFPGCTLTGSAREYDLATRSVAGALDIELLELADWNCCGGVTAASLSERALNVLGRRNLEQVPQEAPELLCPCPHCYTSFARTLASAGQNAAEMGVNLRNILDVFAGGEVLERLVERRTEPLTDLRLAGYYGCKLSRPDPEVASHRSERGSSAGFGESAGALERVIEACGATAVEWPAGADCCGAALGVASGDAAEELLAAIYQAVLGAGAEAIVVACPLCHLNLDLHQYQVSQRLGSRVDVPVFFITELMAVALGIEECEDWLERHVTSPLPMFMRFIEAQEEREYWGEEGPPGEATGEEPVPAAAASEEVGAGGSQESERPGL